MRFIKLSLKSNLNFIKLKYKEIPFSIKASFWFSIAGFLEKGLIFITIPIFTRIMDPIEFGKFSIYASWISFFSLFTTLNLSGGGFNNAMFKFENNRIHYLKSMYGLTILIHIIALSLYSLLNNLFDINLLLPEVFIYFIFVETLGQGIISLWFQYNRFTMNYNKVFIVSIVISLLSTILGIIFVILQPFASSKILSNIIPLIIVSLVLFIKTNSNKSLIDSKFWLYALGFNIPLLLHYVSQVILNVSDRIMIGYYVGIEYTAYYSIAYSVSMIINVFSSSVFAVYTPFLFRKFHEAKPEELSVITIKIINIFSYVTILFMFFSQELLIFFATEEYNSALNVMFPVTLSSFFIVLYGFFATVQLYHTKKIFIIMTSIFVAGLNILLNSITIPKFGFVSAGYTTLISYVIYAFMHFFYTSRILKKKYENKKIFNYSGIFLITLRTTFIAFIFIFFDLGIYKYLFLLTIIAYLVIFRVIPYNKVNSKK